MEQISESKCHGGRHLRFRHLSRALSSDTVFSVYLPPLALKKPVPALYWLSGLTCTDENFSQKSGAQRYAAEHGIALVIPDTSPRGKDVPDVPERVDLGQGAGFYVNATQPPWSTHYRMYEFISDELPALIESELPLVAGLKSKPGSRDSVRDPTGCPSRMYLSTRMRSAGVCTRVLAERVRLLARDLICLRSRPNQARLRPSRST